MRSASTSNSSSSKTGRSMQATWLGETTALVQFIGDSAASRKSEQGIKSLKRPGDTINVLFNPSRRAQSVSSSLLSCRVPRRSSKLNTAESTSNLDDLPEIHYVLLSHTEPERLDTATLIGLHKRDGSSFIVPSGTSRNLIRAGIPSDQITEIPPSKDELFSHNSNKTLRITSIPAVAASSSLSRHSSPPSVSHWIVQHENNLSEKNDPSEESSMSSVLFVASSSRKAHAQRNADSSANELWRTVQARYGPLDLAFIPVWAGQRASKPGLVKRIFSNANSDQIHDYAPVEAADVHQTLRSGLSIAMIHGLEPRLRSPFSDDSDVSDDYEGSLSSIKAPQAVQAITQLKAACDRSERRSVEFRRGQGSIKRKFRNGRRSIKSTFAVLNEGHSISL